MIEKKGRWLDLTLLLDGVSHQVTPLDAGLQSHIVHPLLEVCSRFLTAIVSPMMLLAVISGVLSAGSPRSLNRVGRLVCIRFLCGMILTVFCAGVLCALCFPFRLTAEGDAGSGFLSFLVDIVPSDALTPIMEGNILQIVFIGVIIGIAMLFLQRRVELINRIIEEASQNCDRL